MNAPPFDATVWMRLLVLCSALLFEGMNLSSVSIQLTVIQHDLGMRPDQVQLVASAFLTTYAGFLLMGGKCADHWGARRTFLIGTALFGCASFAATLAQGGFQLVAARALQGAGVAITAPAAVALIATEFPEGALRNRALGVLSATGAAGFCLGVVVSGFVTDRLGWRWSFGLYVPLSAAILVAAPRVLAAPRAPIVAPRGPIPWVPAFVVTSGLMAVVYAAGRTGSASLREIAIVGLLGVLLVGIFVALQVRSPSPLLPPALLARPRMANACIAIGGGFAGITGGTFLVATMLQERLGYSPLGAGLAFLPQVVAVVGLSTPAAKLANRYAPTHLVLAGLGVVALGQLFYTQVESSGYLTAFLPGTTLVGVGIAVLYPGATILAVGSAPAHEQGIASGVLTTCQQAGNALGVALAYGIQANMAGRFGIDSPGLWACWAFAMFTVGVCALLIARDRRQMT